VVTLAGDTGSVTWCGSLWPPARLRHPPRNPPACVAIGTSCRWCRGHTWGEGTHSVQSADRTEMQETVFVWRSRRGNHLTSHVELISY